MALLVARRTNDRKVAGSRPTKVVCITVLTGNRMGVNCRPPLLLPSCRKLEFGLSALMDSDLAWVNGKCGRQSWRNADAFQRSIISEAIYHFIIMMLIIIIQRRPVTENKLYHSGCFRMGLMGLMLKLSPQIFKVAPCFRPKISPWTKRSYFWAREGRV